MKLSLALAALREATAVYVYVLVYTKPQGNGFERAYFQVTKKEARLTLTEIDHEREDPEVHATFERRGTSDSALYIGALPR